MLRILRGYLDLGRYEAPIIRRCTFSINPQSALRIDLKAQISLLVNYLPTLD